jgi:DNA polymerase-3 subunit epsilon
MNIKKIYIDVETTGVDYKTNGLIQIAGLIEIDGEEKETFDILMQPFNNKVITDKALEVNGRTIEEIKTFDQPQIAHKKLINILDQYVDRYNKRDKFLFHAYIPGDGDFDGSFLRQFFLDCGNNYYGSYFFTPAIDISSICAIALSDKRSELENFKLETVARCLGIEINKDQIHNAVEDIRISKKVLDKSLEIINGN